MEMSGGRGSVGLRKLSLAPFHRERRPVNRRVAHCAPPSLPSERPRPGTLRASALRFAQRNDASSRMSWLSRLFGGRSEAELKPQRLDYLNEALALEKSGDFDAAIT